MADEQKPDGPPAPPPREARRNRLLRSPLPPQRRPNRRPPWRRPPGTANSPAKSRNVRRPRHRILHLSRTEFPRLQTRRGHPDRSNSSSWKPISTTWWTSPPSIGRSAPERFDLVYILYSFARNERIRVKTYIADGYRAGHRRRRPPHRQLAGARSLRHVRHRVRGPSRHAPHPDARRVGRATRCARTTASSSRTSAGCRKTWVSKAASRAICRTPHF